MLKEEKNKLLSEAIKATRSKRALQLCKTFKFKVNKSSLSKEQKESLKMFFIEAKRTYNYILNDINNGADLFDYDYKKLNHITYYDKDNNIIEYTNTHIKTSVIQEIIANMRDSIKGLSASKKNGNKVGSLRFKSEYNSIKLKQYGITHSIKGNRIKIQGIKKPIRVCGLKQLDKYTNIDFTTANILYDGYDYYISLTCFIDKENTEKEYKNNIIGIDLGCRSTITLSNGEKVKVIVEESERLKGLQNKLRSCKKRSNNWYKTQSKLRKEYNKMVNRKNDLSNKLVHYLISNNEIIVIQDDQINKWKEKDELSKIIHHSILGRLKSQLKRYDNVILLDNWFPTTQHCFNCGHDTKTDPNKTIFVCENCGLKEDRDIHAANNMIEFYNRYIQSVGTIDLKPRVKISYKNYKDLYRQEAQLSLAAE